ncbi:Negative regulator of beta-lactamase expression [Myxococcus hansupus]|uniref:N-acetylmuramoyl-L-alanine amidase n=1 Tax=Pseudomyxococcus hansupus TaxID=1297742 RepID=A0A0H4X3I2_9BACT|nr:N-acetylmuramoyl-L-alanine amidase [Myxococcus hansupus]AKQ69744.1 Negative regulator of beta-lactamase expression [Myxococcus hansupus]
MHVLRKTFAATAAAMALSACGPQPEVSPEEASPEAQVPAGVADDAVRAVADAARRTPNELDAVFAKAAAEFNVPVSLLKAISLAETRWEHVRGEEEFEGRPAAFGLMALRGQDIIDGAALAGVSADAVRDEPLANVRAAAALLSKHADAAGIDRGDLGAWAPVVVRLTDISDPDIQAQYIHNEVYAALREGAGAFTPTGKVAVSLEASDVEAKFALPTAQALNVVDYPGAVWRTSPNFNARPSGMLPQMIIIHTCEGGYSGCVSWLSNSASGVSAHYVVNETGSAVTQLVRESSRAWHIAAAYQPSLNNNTKPGLGGRSTNDFSVGIEHGGYASTTNFDTRMITSSAKLSCDITRGHNIPRDRYHIVAHGQLQANRSDPGAHWPWTSYINQIRSECGDGGGGGTSAIIVDSNNANNNASLATFSAPATSWTRGTFAGNYGGDYYFANVAPVSEPAVFRFNLAAAGSRTIQAWWPAGTNRSTSAPFIINHTGGATTVSRNQQIDGGKWVTLGTYNFARGWNTVQLSRWTSSGEVVIADAIRVQ